MTKKNEEVMEKAIKDLQNKLNHSVSEEEHLKVKGNLEQALDNLESAVGKYKYENERLQGKYNKEHSLVINLDQELENVREQLRQAREESVKHGKENDLLRGLVKLCL
jgi:chromosome segregation ATPase